MSSSHVTQSAPLFSSLKYEIEGDGPILVADQLKSPENMGHIIRLASNFGCSRVLFIGNKENVRHTKIKKVAGAAAGQVDWKFCNLENWKDYIPEEYEICAIETTDRSGNIAACQLPEQVAFVLGNEIHGLSEDVLKDCSRFYHIPMIGAIKSMNVSHACCVALYEWVKQFSVTGL